MKIVNNEKYFDDKMKLSELKKYKIKRKKVECGKI